MPRRIYNEYDDMDMIEMERRGGSQGQRGGRGGRSGGQGGNRGGQGGRSGRGAQNAYGYGAYGAYNAYPYSEYDDDDWEDEDDMDMYGAYNEMEMRRGVPGSGRGRSRGRGRRRDSRGRFTSMMDEGEGYYPNGPYLLENKQKIGFNSTSRGGASGSEYFNEEELMYMLEEIPDEIEQREAEMWMKKLKNEDGSKGAHWNREQVNKLFKEHKIEEKTGGEVSEDEFYYVMNMLYSDYCKALKENNINSIKVYVELAIAWLMDKDAAENKLARYFYCVTDSE